jgi:selenocysteine lyase/cysteine desulfurase
VEELAGRAGISLRTGCFCNPGAGEIAHGLTASEMRPWFEGTEPISFSALRDQMLQQHGVQVAAVRISVGVASTFADVHRFAGFLQHFVDRSTTEVGQVEFASEHCRVLRDSA